MVEAAARLVLQEYRKIHPEWTDDVTPLEDLAAWLDLNIETFNPQDYPPGTYGFMDADEDEDLIWLCRDLSPRLYRFTLAHEIGHALLHCQEGYRLLQLAPDFAPLVVQANKDEALPALSRTQPCQEADIQEDMAGFQEQEQMHEVLGAHGYSPRSERELMANLFAAELLMPRARLITLYLQAGVPARSLADRFQVSQAALLNRLAGLLDEADHLEELTSTEDQGDKAQETAQKAATASTGGTKSYDQYQQAAITAPTPALIVAGPGSGKTSTLIGRVEYLVKTLNVPAHAILALTFSRKATQEMEERLRTVLNTEEQGLPRVSTFHAFCADLLRQHGALVGLRDDFTLIDDAEGYFMLQQQANALRLRHYQKLHDPAYHFPDLLKVISRAKDELITPDEYARLGYALKEQATSDEEITTAEKVLEIATVYELYQQALAQRGASDFGGLLMLAIQLLRQYPEIRQQQQQKYQHILVDEFQDVNRASGVLLRELAGEEQRVWVVGDANQAIYGFRGASPANIKQFTDDFPDAHIFPLSRNYRSRPDLVALAEAFRTQHLETEEEPGKNQPARLPHSDAYVTIAEATDKECEIAGIITDIRDRLQQGYTCKDMIVLCRTRKDAQDISRALTAAQLPVVEQGGVLEQEYIKDLIGLLLLLCDESGRGLLRMARIPEHPLSQEDIEAILLAAREARTTPRQLLYDGIAPLMISIEGRHAFLHISNSMRSLLQQAQNVWSVLAQYLLVETTLIRDLLVQANAQSKQSQARLKDYSRLLQMARHYDQQQVQRQQVLEQATQEIQAEQANNTKQTEEQKPQHATGEQIASHTESSVQPLTEQIKGFLDYINLLVLLRQDGNSRDSNAESEEQANVIRVMTVHASKGLEFPIVYLPRLMQNHFPSIKRSSEVSVPLELLTGMASGNSHESGEACLFYVGVTRARDHLILSYYKRYGKNREYKRAHYLDALEAGIPKDRIIKLYWQQPYPTHSHQNTTQPTTGTSNETEIIESSQPSEAFIHAMRPAKISVHAIETYQSCPRKYAYSDIYRFTDEPDAYRLFWQATQKTVETLHRLLNSTSNPGEQDTPSEREHQLPTREEISELYNQHWQELGGHTMPFAPLYEEHGQEVVESIRRQLHTSLNDTQERDWQLRKNFAVELGDKTIHVPVDRVEAAQEDSKQPVIFVRTSYGKNKKKPEAKTREFFYTLASRQHFPERDIEVHNHNLSTGERTPLKMTARKEQGLYDKALQALDGMERNDYTARPEEPFHCPGCPFFWICPV
jgi:superfamily I DNA/RNA helicase/Zn-dependent peptidase ImmA (M78 family)/CRISPR/Cas system-associated exonuclease Cas4 (RecB family)